MKRRESELNKLINTHFDILKCIVHIFEAIITLLNYSLLT